MEVGKIKVIQDMIKRHQDACGACCGVKPAGHACSDEDISKVATAEPIGKSDSSDTLKK